MLNTIRAVFRDGKIELLEPVDVPDGASLLVTILSNDEIQFWLGCSQTTLERIWNNPEDDAYGESRW
ncbi:MAG TPA: antitoxin family protein [Pirellulales bacterium]